MAHEGMVLKPVGGHYTFVISNPETDCQNVVCVTMITCRKDIDETRECVLLPGDHVVVSRKSMVAYQFSHVLDAKLINRRIANNTYQHYPPPCSLDLLTRLRDGAFRTNKTPARIREILVQQGYRREAKGD